jgi:hypothetical protein
LHHAVPPVEGSKLGSVNIDGKGDKGDGEKTGLGTIFIIVRGTATPAGRSRGGSMTGFPDSDFTFLFSFNLLARMRSGEADERPASLRRVILH